MYMYMYTLSQTWSCAPACSLIINAYKKDLTEDDLFDLNPRDASDRVIPQFEEQWDKEVSKYRKTE